MLIELDGVTDDGTDSRRGNHIRVEPVFLHRLFLLHRRTISHVHSLSQRPLDIVIIGRKVKEILVKELDVGLGLHHEVRFLLATFCQEWNIPVNDIDLTSLLGHQFCAIEDADATDDGTSDDGCNDRK